MHPYYVRAQREMHYKVQNSKINLTQAPPVSSICHFRNTRGISF